MPREKLIARSLAGLSILAALALVVFWQRKAPSPAQDAKPADIREPAAPPPPPIHWALLIPAKPPQEIEVCGVGGLSRDTADLQDIQSRIDSKMAGERSQWQESMLHSGDPKVRATGLLYASRMNSAWPTKPPPEQYIRPLVQLAVSSQDPAVYAIAVFACRPTFDNATSSACATISAEDWAAMDPDNAVPWLTIAAAARAAKDIAGESAAFAKAAKAARMENYNLALIANAEPALPVGISPLGRYMLTIGLVGIEASVPMPPVSQHCSAAEVTEATVRAQCGAVAELMVSKATTLIELAIGTSIGNRAGWPQDRVAALKERKDALHQLLDARSRVENPQDQWSCDALARANALMSDWARLGEIGTAEQDLEHSSQTAAELAQQFRDNKDAVIRKAQSQAAP